MTTADGPRWPATWLRRRASGVVAGWDRRGIDGSSWNPFLQGDSATVRSGRGDQWFAGCGELPGARAGVGKTMARYLSSTLLVGEVAVEPPTPFRLRQDRAEAANRHDRRVLPPNPA